MEQKKYFDRENEIDIKELFNKILDQKRVILIISAFFTLVGIITALKTPNIYSASSTFITNNNSPSANGNLGGLASLAGINLGNMQANNSEIPPKLYSKLISSTPFLETLSSVQIPHNESTTTLKNYLTIKNVDDNPTLLFLIKKYTFGLPKVIKNALFKSLIPTTNQRTKSADNLKKVSLENEVLFEAIEKSLKLTIDPTQGFIILSFKDTNAKVAASVALEAQKLLQEKIAEFKNKNAQEHLKFTNSLYQRKKLEFEILQDKLALFRDKNQNISSGLFENKLSRLESEFTVLSTVYKDLAVQVETARIRLNKTTPLFTVIEPVIVPNIRDSPNRTRMVMSYMVFGLLFGIVLSPLPFSKKINKLLSK